MLKQGNNPGQLIITAGQIIWTQECEKALNDMEFNPQNKNQLKTAIKRQKGYKGKLVEHVRKPLNSIERLKVVSLITIE